MVGLQERMHNKTSKTEALNLIRLAYDTAISDGDWPHLLKSLASSVDSHSVMLRVISDGAGTAGFSETFNCDPSPQKSYCNHFIHIDHYADAQETAPTNGYTVDNATSRNDATVTYTKLCRGRQTGDYRPEELSFLGLVLPHIAHAAQIQRIIRTASYRQGLAESALDQIRVGVILMDAQVKLIFANHMAEKLVAASSGMLRFSPDGLVIRNPKSALRFHQLIAKVVSTAAGNEARVGVAKRIAICEGSFMQLYVMPLPQQKSYDSGFITPSACAAIFLSLPGNICLPWQEIAEYHGLTQAEAKLAVALASGESQSEIAGRMGISIHTIRTQLKSIFGKTGTKRQSELVALLLQGVLVALCRD